MLTKQAVIDAIMQWPGLYETPNGKRFFGMPVSEVPKQLRECGWRRVPRMDTYYLANLGLEIVTARYVGGVHPKRFCDVVIAADRR
jgi:hypothetical protein